MSSYQMPDPDKLQILLTGLLANDVTAETCTDFSIDSLSAVAVYESASGQIRAGCICDIRLANFLGAALAMIPIKQAQNAADSGVLPENSGENLREVLNIASRLFIKIDSPCLNLRDFYTPGDKAAPGLHEMMKSMSNILPLEVTVDKYGSGKMSFFLDLLENGNPLQLPDHGYFNQNGFDIRTH